MFADATEDHQWIHVDPERAASGPYGGTIAHGLLTRFITSVRVGARVRARAVIDTITTLDGAVQAAVVTTVEVEGSEKPAAVAEARARMARPPDCFEVKASDGVAP